MMESCCFIGHRNCPDNLKELLLSTIETLIIEKQVYRFYVGTQGAFDHLVYEALCTLEKKYPIELFVVLPYLNRPDAYPYYNMEKTIFPDVLTKTPARFAIRKRNSFMINQSNYMITYINTPYSNAYPNLEEALKKKKHVINLGTFIIH